MSFSAIYLPTSLFSLKDSNATNSGAKSLFLPSPYAIKMAILNQAITVGGELEKLERKGSKEFAYVRDAKIDYYISEGSSFCVNNSFVKILKPNRNGDGFAQTVAFREYVHISHPLEIIFDVSGEEAEIFLKQFLHKINYFGKRGCFFQFLKYSDCPNKANVKPFEVHAELSGILQEYDDFDRENKKVSFESVSNFSTKSTVRRKEVLVLPLSSVGSSKSYTVYKVL
uniref:CRISPR-associated protein Cas5 n=1 Tax=Roseihalotalea indica TaxID=2867963 RepID=A0AA49GIS2_9BACT|nr:hypothetical protein K4G66_18725 [Tunicatimonas sp. TK19036]